MPELNQSLCISCGLCARVCPTAHITFENNTPAPNPLHACMECWHCAAVCPQKAIQQEGLDLYPAVPAGELEKLVTMRRSARHFKNEPPAREAVTRALELAAWAPTGKNERTYGWSVVYGKDRVQELLQIVLKWCVDQPRLKVLTKLVKGDRDPVTCGASCVILGHNAETAANPETDVVIAATTAELLLNKQGIGTCWGGYLRRTVDLCPEAREYLGIPEGHHVYAALLTGIPDNEPYRNVPYRHIPDIKWIVEP